MKGTLVTSERERDSEGRTRQALEKKRKITDHGLKVSGDNSFEEEKKERKNCKRLWINRYEEEERMDLYYCFRNSGISISLRYRTDYDTFWVYVSALGMYMVRVYQPVTSRISAVRAFSLPS